MEWESGLLALIAGLAAGAVNSVAGGGTMLSFPTLLFLGLSPVSANATNTIALLTGSLGSVSGYWRQVSKVKRWLRLFAPVSLIGGLVGGILLVETPESVFDRLVPYLVLFATLLFLAHHTLTHLHGRDPSGSPEDKSRAWLWCAVAFQGLVAVYGGYFGAGIGILMLASLSILGFHDIHEMNALKAILAFLINVTAALYFALKAPVDWPLCAWAAVGAICGGRLGAKVAQRVSQKLVRRAIAGAGLLISGVLFYRQYA